jgi:hypothetical protein
VGANALCKSQSNAKKKDSQYFAHHRAKQNLFEKSVKHKDKHFLCLEKEKALHTYLCIASIQKSKLADVARKAFF